MIRLRIRGNAVESISNFNKSMKNFLIRLLYDWLRIRGNAVESISNYNNSMKNCKKTCSKDHLMGRWEWEAV